MRAAFANLLELLGMGLLALAAFQVGLPLGLAVSGIAAIVVASGLEQAGEG